MERANEKGCDRAPGLSPVSLGNRCAASSGGEELYCGILLRGQIQCKWRSGKLLHLTPSRSLIGMVAKKKETKQRVGTVREVVKENKDERQSLEREDKVDMGK